MAVSMEFPKAIAAIKKAKNTRQNRPLVVAVMGQSGVGKSSLLNALFRTNFLTSPIGRTSLNIEQVINPSSAGYEVHFYALPGIGLLARKTSTRRNQYREIFQLADVVLWAITADNQDLETDAQTIEFLTQKKIKFGKAEVDGSLLNKITFVLTKSDMLVPAQWSAEGNGSYATVLPSPKTEQLLEAKEDYCRDTLLGPFSKFLVTDTYHAGNFEINSRYRGKDGGYFEWDERGVKYHGLLTGEEYDELVARYPVHKDVFHRLYNGHTAIACSSVFKYNLASLMFAITFKLAPDAEPYFQPLLKPSIDRASRSALQGHHNVVYALSTP